MRIDVETRDEASSIYLDRVKGKMLESTAEIPILMYHSIDLEGPSELAPYRLSPSLFKQHVEYLAENGYRSISLEEWVQAMRTGQRLPGRPIIITFDDGYLNFLQNAWPVLEQAKFTATMFVVTDKVGLTADWDAVTGEKLPLMNWEDLRYLRDQGLVIGSHTASHPSLPKLSTEDIVKEGKRARVRLLEELGTDVTSIAFPYGHTDQRVQGALAEAGYRIAVGTWGGVSTLLHDPLNLPRIELFPDDNLTKFAAKITPIGPRLAEAPSIRNSVEGSRLPNLPKDNTERCHMLIHPDYALRLAAQLDTLVSGFVTLHSQLLTVSGQPPTLQTKLTHLFRQPVTGTSRRDVAPYEVLSTGIRIGFEKDARVTLEVEPKTDHGSSPENCANTVDFKFTGPSSWLSVECDCEWADLSSMSRYQLGIYATVNRRVSGRAALRLPSKDGKSINLDFSHFVLDKDNRNLNKSGELRNFDFINLDTDKRPTLLLVFETRNIPDLSVRLNYLTVLFD